ncbi:MAG TPA: ABC transporter ATP-binding protein [Casimicrobiaceae bacterium]|nr:ABC transporter ATP-binding protein [Casimicrobiaceae bacterium]
MKAASIEFRGVVKRYGEVVAVRDVSFTVAPGTLVTLLGPSGCGKTTILRLIAGLELPSEGGILIGSRDVTAVGAAERDVSMVFQSYALFPHMSVLQNVRYGLVVSGMKAADADARGRDALASVGLAGYDDRLPSELSGGQQQRVAVARALVLEPSVLLFDEPLSNLDARLRRQMREEIRDLQQRLGLTVVYVTHDQAEAMAVSDRIIVMNRARIAQEGAPRELYERPGDAFVAGFMGDANRVRGILARRDGDPAQVALGPVTLRPPPRGLPDREVDVSIRPEAIVLVDARDAAIAAKVRKATYLGGSIEYTLDTALGELFVVSLAVERPREAGSDVGVNLSAHGVVVIPPGAADGGARD